MPLTPGSRLGPYVIKSPLGAGGMGEVYRAHDTTLNREVAIKILGEGMSADPDRLARFRREAQVLASLNHPNIAQIYGVETGPSSGPSPGINALVMELVEGTTLDRLCRPSGLRLDVAVAIARQIADALEAAHDLGIVHRDLKPANIKVRPDDTVKVLDFGLAKATESLSPDSAAQSTTISPAMTAQGIILGTAAYMSPEQARGRTVDKRTDVWAFGCVLYEMLTGKPLFAGETVTDVLAAILERQPDWNALPADVPPHVRVLLARCLERDPKRRLRDIGDARLMLDEPPVPASAPGSTAAPTRRRGGWGLAAAIGAVAATGAVLATWLAMRPPAARSWTAYRLGGPAQAFSVRLSPDGQLLAFLAFVNQLPQLAVMRPEAASWTALTHDRARGAVVTASWAPDGSRIYYDRVWGHALGVFWVPPLGGDERPLLDDAFGPEALADGSLIVLKPTDKGDEQLFHYWPDSRRLEPLPIFMADTDVAPVLRAFPDGREIVFKGMTETTRSEAARLLVYDITTKTARELVPGNPYHVATQWAPVAVSPDGRFVYIPTDVGDSQVIMEVSHASGAARPILTFSNASAPVSIDAARDGSLYLDQLQMAATMIRTTPSGAGLEETLSPPGGGGIAAPGGDLFQQVSIGGHRHLALVGMEGEPRVPVDTSDDTTVPATTFGGQIAFTIGTGTQRTLALASLRDGRVIRRYSSRSDNGLSASPDGRTLYYSFGGAIWAQPVDGGAPSRVTDGTDVVADPNGQYLYVKRNHSGTIAIGRCRLSDGVVEELPAPPQYHVTFPELSSAAVDGHSRLLISVAPAATFYYRTAILDWAAKSFTIVPLTIDADFAAAGWTPDGHIVAQGRRYLLSLWHYRPSKTDR